MNINILYICSQGMTIYDIEKMFDLEIILLYFFKTGNVNISTLHKFIISLNVKKDN